MGKMATSPLPSRGSAPLQSGGGKSEVAHKWAKWLRHPCRLGDPHRCRAGGKSEVAHLWAKWLRHPCRLGDPHRCRAGGEIRSSPQVGKMATSPLPCRGSPPLQSGGGESEVAHKWARWLRHPCRLGNPHRFRAGGGGESEVAHLWAKWLRHPCRLRDPHRCRAGGGNQKWPTSGQSGYLTAAVSGIPTASERGEKSEVAHKWAKWLPHPCRIGDPHRFRAGGENQKWPTSGQGGYVTPAVSGIPTASERGGGGDQKWPTCGQSGYVTPAVSGISTAAERGGGGDQKWPTSGQSCYLTAAVSGIPTASERGAKSEVAHKWAKWLPHPCRIGDPHRFRAGGGNQKWPTSGQSGYVTPAVSGIPTASERGGKSEVAHKWAKWLLHPCRLGDPHRCTAGGEIRSGPQVGKVATSPLPSRGSPPLQIFFPLSYLFSRKKIFY